MLRDVRILIAILFWIVQLWWLGHVVQALRHAPDGTFRVYSVLNNGVQHDAWGLTFTGEPGRALALAYLALIAYALIGMISARRLRWIPAAIILLAWAVLFAGNSLWLSQWSRLEWWDWVNFAGLAIVVAQIAWSGRRRCAPSAAGGSLSAERGS